MGSRFGWLDHDDAQRAAMHELVRMFQDQGSVDELGIGSIRDAFSNSFFPGTSVLHTRARYLLFVPWLVADVVRRGYGRERAQQELRSLEVRVIKSLLAGGEDSGVIGNRAQERLKTMPSQLYWPALQRYQVVRWRVGIDGFLRRAAESTQRGLDVTEADAVDGRGTDVGLDPALPVPPPGLLTATNFALLPDEASYLQAVFARLPGDSLLRVMAARPDLVSGDHIWTAPALDLLPPELRTRVDHARRLHHAWYGAPLLYNLMLAEIVGDDGLVDDYRQQMKDWEAELDEHRVFDGWSQAEFWSLIRTLNPRLQPPTQRFVSRWFKLAETGSYESAAARDLIRDREFALKRRRSRLLDPQARESWTPGAGTVRLGYRWEVVTSFLRDVSDGLARGLDETGAA